MKTPGPGDQVMCVVEGSERSDGIQPHWVCGAEVRVGEGYTIMRVVTDENNFGEISTGFVLVEPDTHWPRGCDGDYGAWGEEHFRTLDELEEMLLTEMGAAEKFEPA